MAFPPDISTAIPFSGTFPSFVVNTLVDPPEGKRALPLVLTKFSNRVDIPAWNTSTQQGLSQIAAIIIDTTQLTVMHSAWVYFPDTQEYYVVRSGRIATLPVHTSGLSFYAGYNGGLTSLPITVLNFFQPPSQIDTGGGGDYSDLINDVNIAYINGATPGLSPGGNLPVDIKAQSLSPLVVGFNGVAQPVTPPGTPVARTASIVLANGVVDTTLFAGSGTLYGFDVYYSMSVSGAVNQVIRVKVDGVTIWNCTIPFGAAGSLTNQHIIAPSFNLPFTTSVIVETNLASLSGTQNFLDCNIVKN